MSVEAAIDEAIASLGLADRIRRVPDEEAENALRLTATEFVEDPSSLWWWESLVTDKTTASYHAAGNGYQLIPKICPNELIWFVATDDRESDWSVYEATPADIAAILGECHAFEYFIASRKSEWVVFENHHDTIIGVGNEVAGAIDNISK